MKNFILLSTLTLTFFIFISSCSYTKEENSYVNRGNAKYDLQDFRGAIQDYSKAIELDPSYAKAYYNRGDTKYFLNDIDGACLDWSKAGELGYYDAYDRIKEYCN